MTIAISISVLALAVAIVAIVIATKKQTVNVIKETETNTVVEHAPSDHPFYYDERNKVYTLDGDLRVNGSVSCLDIKK